MAGLPEAYFGGDGVGLCLVVTAVPHRLTPIIYKLGIPFLQQHLIEQRTSLQPDAGEETAVSIPFACLRVKFKVNGRYS